MMWSTSPNLLELLSKWSWFISSHSGSQLRAQIHQRVFSPNSCYTTTRARNNLITKQMMSSLESETQRFCSSCPFLLHLLRSDFGKLVYEHLHSPNKTEKRVNWTPYESENELRIRRRFRCVFSNNKPAINSVVVRGNFLFSTTTNADVAYFVFMDIMPRILTYLRCGGDIFECLAKRVSRNKKTFYFQTRRASRRESLSLQVNSQRARRKPDCFVKNNFISMR